jgi:RNA polymerase sigma-70 factor (family 1)
MPDYSHFSDAELTDLLKSNDHAAFTEIYKRYFGLLYQHALKMTKDEDEAEDIIHELFVTLWSKSGELSFSPNLPAYLYRAVKNKVINTFQQQKTRQAHIESLQAHINAGTWETQETINANLLAAEIESHVTTLPKKMREVFLLSRKANLSHKEIAETLGISDKTVKKQINNAIHQLRLKINTLLFSILL